jgi:hypothetical protein
VIDSNQAALTRTALLTEEERFAVVTNAIRIFPSLRHRLPAS